MSNALRYIRSLEAAGFPREQAEVQVQMVLDILEGDFATKADLAVLSERMDSKFARVDARFAEVDARFAEFELRIITRLGALTVACFTLSTAILGWLIKTS